MQYTEKYGTKKKDPKAELAEQYARPRALEFNVGEGASRNDTGVRFEDVAGIDDVKENIIEVIKMMRGDERYSRMGAKPPRVCILNVLKAKMTLRVRESCWKDLQERERRF